ncbi:TPA: hypothetical protein MIQ75_26605, partial [Klebsiella pneumoniae]|nr:hypothetical protein [Klebsiella pneumoniae]
VFHISHGDETFQNISHNLVTSCIYFVITSSGIIGYKPGKENHICHLHKGEHFCIEEYLKASLDRAK